MLKPNIDEMLNIGWSCGLNTLEEAYSNYMNHYDMFFLISDYKNQYKEFTRDLAIRGYLELCENDTKMQLIEITIPELIDVTGIDK